MTSAHLTTADVTAFRERRLDRARVEAIGAHVRDCGQCARLLWTDRRIAESTDAMWKSERSPLRSRFLPAIAAALAVIIAGVVIWSLRQEQHPARIAGPSTLRDGSVAITVNADGSLRDVSTPRPEWNALAADALRSGTPPRAGTQSLHGTAAVLRGQDEAAQVKLLEPVGMVVESDRPQFRWTLMLGARYRVLIAREGAVAAKSALLTGDSWSPDASLPRGAVYDWQLLVVAGAHEWPVPPPNAPPARFRVLADPEMRELDAARTTGSHLLAGLVGARLGLDDVAARELAAFAANHRRIRAASTLARHYERPAPTTTNGDQ